MSDNTRRVTVEESDYLIIDLPDGTTIDVSIDPANGNNHIKMYDDNEYAVMPMDSDSKLRPLDVWTGPVKRSTRSGTTPGEVTTVEPNRTDD